MTMHTAALIVFPPLAGLIIAWSGKRLLGDTNTTFIAVLATCAAVGVGFATTLIH